MVALCSLASVLLVLRRNRLCRTEGRPGIRHLRGLHQRHGVGGLVGVVNEGRGRRERVRAPTPASGLAAPTRRPHHARPRAPVGQTDARLPIWSNRPRHRPRGQACTRSLRGTVPRRPWRVGVERCRKHVLRPEGWTGYASGTLPVPAFTLDGFLPPYLGGSPATAGAQSPYKVSTPDLVAHFATSPERIEILQGFLKHRKGLADAGIVSGFQWVDGSFVQQDITRPPADIDTVIFFERPAALKDAAAYKSLLATIPSSSSPRSPRPCSLATRTSSI